VNQERVKHNQRDFYIKIAKMYYIDELSQQEISEKVDLSRSNISKILKACKKMNIVEVKVNDISSFGLKLQQNLQKLFHLKKVVVIPSDDDEEQTKINVGKRAAELLSTLIHDSMHIGLTRGSTLYHVVNQMEMMNRMQIEVVQMVGGTGFFNMMTDGHELTTSLAEKLGGESRVLQAPLFVKNAELRKMLIAEPDIAQLLKEAEAVELVLMGLGTNHIESSAFCRFGFMTEEESLNMLALGAVGDICGRQIDINGQEFDAEMNDRVIAVELEKVKLIPQKVVVAAGVHKAEVILGALRGGFIDYLVIDEDAAMNVLGLINQS
jgi:deoxyribonucleoside regulator